MNISNPRYVSNMGRPLLELEIDGITTLIDLEPKPTLHKAGIVFLGAEMEDHVPVIEFKGKTLRGFTRDRRIKALVEAMAQAVKQRTFVEGPVPLPD